MFAGSLFPCLSSHQTKLLTCLLPPCHGTSSVTTQSGHSGNICWKQDSDHVISWTANPHQPGLSPSLECYYALESQETTIAHPNSNLMTFHWEAQVPLGTQCRNLIPALRGKQELVRYRTGWGFSPVSCFYYRERIQVGPEAELLGRNSRGNKKSRAERGLGWGADIFSMSAYVDLLDCPC